MFSDFFLLFLSLNSHLISSSCFSWIFSNFLKCLSSLTFFCSLRFIFFLSFFLYKICFIFLLSHFIIVLIYLVFFLSFWVCSMATLKPQCRVNKLAWRKRSWCDQCYVHTVLFLYFSNCKDKVLCALCSAEKVMDNCIGLLYRVNGFWKECVYYTKSSRIFAFFWLPENHRGSRILSATSTQRISYLLLSFICMLLIKIRFILRDRETETDRICYFLWPTSKANY